MIRAPSWSLRTYFRTYALLFSFLPCALMAVFLSFYLSNRLQERHTGEIQRALLLQKQFLDTWMGDRQRDLVRLSKIQEVTELDTSFMDRIFRRFLSVMPEFRSLGFIGTHGHTVVDTIGRTGIYLGDRAYFLAGQEGHPFVSDVLTGRASGDRLIIFAAPVQGPAGDFRGVLFAPVSLAIVEKAISDTLMEQGGQLLLLDRSGMLIAGNGQPGHDGERDSPHAAKSSLQLDGRTFPYTAGDGTRMLAVALPLQTEGWVLVGAIPEEAVDKAVRPVVAVIFAAGVLSLLAISPLIFSMARALENVAGPLARHAQSVAQGNYDLPTPELKTSNAPRELRTLATAYESMRSKIVKDMRLLETMALTDELTKLPNRRFLMEEGLRLLEISARASRPCSCMVIDVDHFKDINDRFGHSTGDQVLAALANVFRESLRGADLVGRLGGEEFLVICTNTGAADARNLAGRLLQNLRGVDQGPLAEHNITVSIGVATLMATAEDAPALFDRLVITADMAMYKAKTSGRNKVVLADCDPKQTTCPNFII